VTFRWCLRSGTNAARHRLRTAARRLLAELSFRLAATPRSASMCCAARVVITFCAVFWLGASIVGLTQRARRAADGRDLGVRGADARFRPAVLPCRLTALALFSIGAPSANATRSLGSPLGARSAPFAHHLFGRGPAGADGCVAVATERGRASLTTIYPYAVLPIVPAIACRTCFGCPTAISARSDARDARRRGAINGQRARKPSRRSCRLGRPGDRHGGAAGRPRRAVRNRACAGDPLRKTFVYVFALAPALVATWLPAISGQPIRREARARWLCCPGLR